MVMMVDRRYSMQHSIAQDVRIKLWRLRAVQQQVHLWLDEMNGGRVRVLIVKTKEDVQRKFSDPVRSACLGRHWEYHLSLFRTVGYERSLTAFESCQCSIADMAYKHRQLFQAHPGSSCLN